MIRGISLVGIHSKLEARRSKAYTQAVAYWGVQLYSTAGNSIRSIWFRLPHNVTMEPPSVTFGENVGKAPNTPFWRFQHF